MRGNSLPGKKYNTDRYYLTLFVLTCKFPASVLFAVQKYFGFIVCLIVMPWM